MIVVDASAMVELILAGAGDVAAICLSDDRSLHAPAHLDVEVLNALRRLARRGRVSDAEAGFALDAFYSVPVRRYPIEPFRDRVWQLRANLSAYDAAYIALAEGLRADLVTYDCGIAGAPGNHASVRLLRSDR